ncbi:hypothetical protein GCM10022222_38820 [Amycolatopsis ultiminotia]|uniref:PucR C-terminal helix-turn-helix domain-containing protein n=1 Tax=Amycolatopsis ultiminotia TaxID=543629 RepID=A0ABP6WLH9_9PSEU
MVTVPARENGRVWVLCHRLIARLSEVSPAITAAIRVAEPSYLVTPEAEHNTDVYEHLLRLLRSLADERDSDAGDVDRAVAAGRQRAAQGIPVQAMIGAWQIANREIWELLRSEAGTERGVLADIGARIFTIMHLISTTAAEAHGEVSRTLHADQITLSHRFVAMLRAAEIDDETRQIAASIGFDPDGWFIALSSHLSERDDPSLSSVREGLGAGIGTAVAVVNSRTLVVVAQSPRPDELVDAVARLRPDAPLAVGHRRAGLVGAMRSIHDAHCVLSTLDGAAPPVVRRFEETWLQATLVTSQDDLEILVRDRLETVRANRHLAEAVVAFAENDLSATSAARAMRLHANTTAYRLNRWQELTGWNPKTFSGLATSLLACWLAAKPDAEETEHRAS